VVGCNRQDFDWAVSVLHSRCFIQGPQSIHMTVPGVDMANHSFSPNATVRCRSSALLAVAQSHTVLTCNSIYSMLLAVLLGCGAEPCPVLSHALSLPCPFCAVALLCPALHMSCKRCPALPRPALYDGLVTFGSTVTGVCTALRPVKGGKQKKMCVTPLQHSLPCFSCCPDLMASGKLLLSPAP